MAHLYQEHEKDARWAAVDHYALSHLHPPSAPYYSGLQSAVDKAAQSGLPDIAVSPLQGQFLALQCKLIGAKHILEVGTLGGYSTIWLATSDPDAKVTTVDVDPTHLAVARDSIDHAGVGKKVETIQGPGVDILPKLKAEVVAGKRPKFDFTFIDADKENNLFYVNEAIQMSRPGACIVVDNVVRRGLVADAELAKTSVTVSGSRKAIEGAAADERLDATIIQVVGEKNYDGMLICRVK